MSSVVDDWTLLRAINRVEEGPNRENVLDTYVMGNENFKIVKEDEHLRTLLKGLLELNIAVRQKRREAPQRSSLARLFRMGRLKEYQGALDALVLERDEAFKKYEMLRRLVAWENTYLARPKA